MTIYIGSRHLKFDLVNECNSALIKVDLFITIDMLFGKVT